MKRSELRRTDLLVGTALWFARLFRGLAGIYVVLGTLGILAGLVTPAVPGYENFLLEQAVQFAVACTIFFGGRVLINKIARRSGISARLLQSVWSL
jgi:membrane-bound ClpP family serine protease